MNKQDRQQRVESSQELLEVYNTNPEDFHTCLVTGNETWLHHWDPDTKKRVHAMEASWLTPPKKFRTQPSASKVMATVFWDAKRIILIDYKPAGTSVTGEYYANVIKQLRVAIKEKQRGKLAAGVLFCMIMPLCTSPELYKRLFVSAFEQLNHPPYRPDPGPK